MDTLEIKQKIHEYIDQADERFLRLVYSMVESEEGEDKLFSSTDQDMIDRTKASLKSVESGQTRNIHAFKKDVDTWKNNQTAL